jgi:hypothetical protein
MKGDFHVRACESLRGKFPWATLPNGYSGGLFAYGTQT